MSIYVYEMQRMIRTCGSLDMAHLAASELRTAGTYDNVTVRDQTGRVINEPQYTAAVYISMETSARAARRAILKHGSIEGALKVLQRSMDRLYYRATEAVTSPEHQARIDVMQIRWGWWTEVHSELLRMSRVAAAAALANVSMVPA